MRRRPPRSTRTAALVPCTNLFRSAGHAWVRRPRESRGVRADLPAGLRRTRLPADLADQSGTRLAIRGRPPPGRTAERPVRPGLSPPPRPALAAGLCLARDHGLSDESGRSRPGTVRRGDQDADRPDRDHPPGHSGHDPGTAAGRTVSLPGLTAYTELGGRPETPAPFSKGRPGSNGLAPVPARLHGGERQR